MTTETPDDQETDVAQWYREKVLNGEFEDIPQTDAFCEVHIPEEAEEIARKRCEAARANGREVSLFDYLNDHVNLHMTFVINGEVPDDERGLVSSDDREV